MDKQDLVFRAGSALGLDFFRSTASGLWVRVDDDERIWNSLEHDEDAMQLSRELKISAVVSDDVIQAGPTGQGFTVAERVHGDISQTLRLAITRAAALMYRGEE